MTRLQPLRRRGTECQRVRRLRKWARRGRYDLIAANFPIHWRSFVHRNPVFMYSAVNAKNTHAR